LVTGNVFPGDWYDGIDVFIHQSVRKNIMNEVVPMIIYLTGAVAAFLLIYLTISLIRPEWF